MGSHQGSSYSYQAFNRLVSANGTSFSHDANGNQILKSDGNGSWIYSWDYENRLKQAALSGGVTVSYSYDALGRRVQRTSSMSGITRFVYDGVDVVRDLDGSNATIADYLNGLGIDDKLRQASNSTASYFLTDHLGTSRALSDPTGTISSNLQYDSFGNLTSGTPSARYTFTGREFDQETALMYYRVRWYHPQEGRFISEDPIDFECGINFYPYVHNDPLDLIDPFGLQDGPRNVLRNPCPPESWICNGISNTLSDLLGLDRVAELGWDIGDHRRPTDERLKDTLELAGRTAIEAGAGGVILGKVCKVGSRLLKRRGLIHPSRYFGSKTAQQATDTLRSKFDPPRGSRPGADTFYNPSVRRSYNVHTDPRHGPPHVDVRRRGGYPERKYPLRGN